MKPKFSHLANQRPDPIPLTRQKHQQLKIKQKQLLQDQEEVLVRLNTAREQGDLSENGAYKYAKFELGNVRRELKKVNHLLRWGQVMEVSQSGGQIGFGNTVTLRNDQRELSFMLVSQHESNPTEKKLSTDSPYGQAVMGKSLGDQVVIKAPAGEFAFTIADVS